MRDPNDSMIKIWRECLTVPCDHCRVPAQARCVTRDGKEVLQGNGPHSMRQARLRGGYAWRRVVHQVGPFALMPGPSPDGEIRA